MPQSYDPTASDRIGAGERVQRSAAFRYAAVAICGIGLATTVSAFTRFAEGWLPMPREMADTRPVAAPEAPAAQAPGSRPEPESPVERATAGQPEPEMQGPVAASAPQPVPAHAPSPVLAARPEASSEAAPTAEASSSDRKAEDTSAEPIAGQLAEAKPDILPTDKGPSEPSSDTDQSAAADPPAAVARSAGADLEGPEPLGEGEAPPVPAIATAPPVPAPLTPSEPIEPAAPPAPTAPARLAQPENAPSKAAPEPPQNGSARPAEQRPSSPPENRRRTAPRRSRFASGSAPAQFRAVPAPAGSAANVRAYSFAAGTAGITDAYGARVRIIRVP